MRMSQTSTVCSLSAKNQPLSTTSWMPVTVREPSSASAPAYVLHCVPDWSCEVSQRQASLLPIRLPLSTSVFGVQPVKVGDGPRYTNAFWVPKLIWNRGVTRHKLTLRHLGGPPSHLRNRLTTDMRSAAVLACCVVVAAGCGGGPKSATNVVTTKTPSGLVVHRVQGKQLLI